MGERETDENNHAEYVLLPHRVDAKASPFSMRPFTQPSKITVPVTCDPDDLFSLFLTPALAQSILIETNLQPSG